MVRMLLAGLLTIGAYAQYGESSGESAYEAPQAAAVAEYSAPQEETIIHPSCDSGGPTIRTASAGGYGASAAMGHESEYRKLNGKVVHRKLSDYVENAQRTLFEDDLEEPYDDPGCGHGVCVMTLGDRSE